MVVGHNNAFMGQDNAGPIASCTASIAGHQVVAFIKPLVLGLPMSHPDGYHTVADVFHGATIAEGRDICVWDGRVVSLNKTF